MKKCPVCDSNSIYYGQADGYVEGFYYSVFQCEKCSLQFAEGDISKLNLIYEAIYNHSSNINGYDRYHRYFNEIQNIKGTKAIDYLVNSEDTYKYIYYYLKRLENYQELKILEIGSGLGYFTYALHEDGFNIQGIDLSENAVKKSTKVFGNLYKRIDFNDLDEKFDIIILTEVIEHVTDPVMMIRNLKRILKADGEILLTTPRKFSKQSKSLWLTELPPVHLFWFTSLALKEIGRKVELDYFEMNVLQKNVVYNSKNNSKSALNSNFLPNHRTKNIVGPKTRIKTIIYNISPFFIKRIYHLFFKKTKSVMSKSHRTIFFGYRMK